MDRARSRLQATQSPPTEEKTVASTHRQTPLNSSPKLLQSYLKRLPTLVVGLLFLASTYWFVHHIKPTQIQNWPLPHMYGPLQILIFFMLFFLLSFIFLHRRRGLIAALTLQTLLFLKLQLIELSPLVILAVLAFFGTIELSANLFQNLTNRRKTSH
jgi:hypothetical protein